MTGSSSLILHYRLVIILLYKINHAVCTSRLYDSIFPYRANQTCSHALNVFSILNKDYCLLITSCALILFLYKMSAVSASHRYACICGANPFSASAAISLMSLEAWHYMLYLMHFIRYVTG